MRSKKPVRLGCYHRGCTLGHCVQELDSMIVKWEGGERIDTNTLIRFLIQAYRKSKIEGII